MPGEGKWWYVPGTVVPEDARADRPREFVLMGTGTSTGVPMPGCFCPVCLSDNPRNHRMRSGVLIEAPEGNIVIDTSPELRLQLIREKVRYVHAAVFTHQHADHVMGLDDLRLFGHMLDTNIPLLCEERVETVIRRAFDYAFKPAHPNEHAGAVPRFELRRIGLEPFDLLGQRFIPIRLWHGKLPILGFRVGDIAFCTDVSRIPDESWPLLEGLDVLVLNSLRDKPHPTHFNIAESLEAIARIQPKRAFLTHISHWLEHEETNRRLPPGVEMAYDGLRFPITS